VTQTDTTPKTPGATFTYSIPYEIYLMHDLEVPYWALRVDYPDLYAALNITADEYDGSHDKICKLLLASGAPDWLEHPIDGYEDEFGLVIWGGEITPYDKLVQWAVCYPNDAQTMDDEEGLRKRFDAWMRSQPFHLTDRWI
jgi:hypothetical protein